MATLEQIIESLEWQIQSCDDDFEKEGNEESIFWNRETFHDRTHWGLEHGVLISRNEAKFILEKLKEEKPIA